MIQTFVRVVAGLACAALMLGAIAWLGAERTGPMDADLPMTSGPLMIPQQARYESEPAPDPPEAIALWRRALDAFQTETDRRRSFLTAAPLLRALWNQWPGTVSAIQAQLLALEDPSIEHGPLATDYTRRALEFPGLYFALAWQAASQDTAARAIRWLAETGEANTAWRLCLRLRWLSPRIERLAPACRKVAASHPGGSRASGVALDSLPRQVVVHRLPEAALDSDLAAVLRRYVANPYDAELLARGLAILWEADFRDTAVALRPELLELDPDTLCSLESNMNQFGLRKRRKEFTLSVMPWD